MSGACHGCVYRLRLVTSAHSACGHPAAVALAGGSPDASPIARLRAPERASLPQFRSDDLRVEGHEQGIRNGWFAWPFNFDPVWLTHCDGFEAVAPGEDGA